MCICVLKHFSLHIASQVSTLTPHLPAAVFRTAGYGLFRIWFTNISWKCSKAPTRRATPSISGFTASKYKGWEWHENVHRDPKKIWKIKCAKIERQIYLSFPVHFLCSYTGKGSFEWYQVIHIGWQLSDLQVPCARQWPAIQHRPSRLPAPCIDGSNDWPSPKTSLQMDPWLDVPR